MLIEKQKKAWQWLFYHKEQEEDNDYDDYHDIDEEEDDDGDDYNDIDHDMILMAIMKRTLDPQWPKPLPQWSEKDIFFKYKLWQKSWFTPNCNIIVGQEET